MEFFNFLNNTGVAYQNNFKLEKQTAESLTPDSLDM